MSSAHGTKGRDIGRTDVKSTQGRRRLTGIDAARGVALIGLMAIHLLPSSNEDTGDPTLTWNLFSGHSAALFALLAGVGLALSTGGQTPHPGRRMAGNRLGLTVRAVLIGVIALLVAAFMPQGGDPPAYGILLYYSVFFLLAIPFLHLGPKALFLSAAGFGVIAPVLVQKLSPLLPEWSSLNPTLGHLFSEPAAVASELLLSGSYPALAYMCYILAGLGIGRLNLWKNSTLAYIAAAGAALVILANTASSVLLYAAGGYEQLLSTPGMTRGSLDHTIVWGPGTIPDTSSWWLVIVTPHANTPLSIAQSLGYGLLVVVLLLLASRKIERWLRPLAAMGAMTLTLYSAHLLALSPEVHYEEPVLWFVVHLAFAVVFGMIWRRWLGQGPLERPVSAAAKNFRQIVDYSDTGGSSGSTGTATR